jgi:undecaprenyl-diphosphatase
VTDFLFGIDSWLFHLINQTLSNPVGDFLWPLITDYNQIRAVQIPLVITWIVLLIFGGRRGRTVAIMIPFVILLSDQISSALIKQWIARPRPCHEIDGVPIVQGIRLLVDCGPGKSFPSSHAVNNFAIGTVFAFYYPRLKWWFYGFASLVAISRVAVGVHYPSDVAGGALIGSLIAFLVIFTYGNLEQRFLAERQKRAGQEKP